MHVCFCILYITNSYSQNSKTFSFFSHVFNHTHHTHHTHHISICFTVGYKFVLFSLFLRIYRYMLNTESWYKSTLSFCLSNYKVSIDNNPVKDKIRSGRLDLHLCNTFAEMCQNMLFHSRHSHCDEYERRRSNKPDVHN